MEHIILTEDVVQHNGRSLNEFYNPVHLLQLAHNATLQMSIEIKPRTGVGSDERRCTKERQR